MLSNNTFGSKSVVKLANEATFKTNILVYDLLMTCKDNGSEINLWKNVS